MTPTRPPSGAPMKASQRRTWRAPPPPLWIANWEPSAKVAWNDRLGTFLREPDGDQVELLIGGRTYRVRRAEVRSA